MKKVLLVVSLVVATVGCGFFQEGENAELKAQRTFNLEVSKIQLQGSKLDQDLRLKVAQMCLDKGKIPVLINGNVDCK